MFEWICAILSCLAGLTSLGAALYSWRAANRAKQSRDDIRKIRGRR